LKQYLNYFSDWNAADIDRQCFIRPLPTVLPFSTQQNTDDLLVFKNKSAAETTAAIKSIKERQELRPKAACYHNNSDREKQVTIRMSSLPVIHQKGKIHCESLDINIRY